MYGYIPNPFKGPKDYVLACYKGATAQQVTNRQRLNLWTVEYGGRVLGSGGTAAHAWASASERIAQVTRDQNRAGVPMHGAERAWRDAIQSAASYAANASDRDADAARAYVALARLAHELGISIAKG